MSPPPDYTLTPNLATENSLPTKNNFIFFFNYKMISNTQSANRNATTHNSDCMFGQTLTFAEREALHNAAGT